MPPTKRESEPFSLTTLESELKKKTRISRDAANSQILLRVEKDLLDNLLYY